MPEFRKKLTINEVETGTVFWQPEHDKLMRLVIPQTLVFDIVYETQEYSNLSVEWDNRRLFIGSPVAHATPGSEIVLSHTNDKPTTIMCYILAPRDKMIIRKRLSHQEHNRRYLKWFAREDELYNRFFNKCEEFEILISGKRIKGRQPDYEKRKLHIGDLIRAFNPGDDLLVYWKQSAETSFLVVEKEEQASDCSGFDDSSPLRSLVARLLSRPLNNFNDGEVKALIVLLEENKKLWERIINYQEESRRLKEQVNMLESLFEQFSSNSFFRSKKEFESWVSSHISLFEKGLRVIHKFYTIQLTNGKKRRIDIICQDKKGVLVAVQILYCPLIEQISETLELIDELKKDVELLGDKLTGGQLKAREVRGMVISNYEKTDMIELCLQKKIKLCMVKSGCLIDILE